MKLSLFCFHAYKVKAIKSNFYGEATYKECKKCKKERVDIIGWPELGLPSKTTYTRY